jgi:DNA (cytosine-5)-methyltransferase 1
MMMIDDLPPLAEDAPVLGDFFCSAGGAAMGYRRAGFRVIGFDINPQPRYPFEFHQGDAFELFETWLPRLDAVHASPPCQDWSRMALITGGNGTAWMLGETLRVLRRQPLPWVVENVEGAPLDGITLCGTSFGLKVKRHRLFESPVTMTAPRCGSHAGEMYSPAGHGDPNWRNRDQNPHLRGAGYTQRCREAMGIDWMNRDQLAQAIPPAYTHHIGEQLIKGIRNGR